MCQQTFLINTFSEGFSQIELSRYLRVVIIQTRDEQECSAKPVGQESVSLLGRQNPTFENGSQAIIQYFVHRSGQLRPHPVVRGADEVRVAQRFIAEVRSGDQISPRSGRLKAESESARNLQSQSSVSRTSFEHLELIPICLLSAVDNPFVPR